MSEGRVRSCTKRQLFAGPNVSIWVQYRAQGSLGSPVPAPTTVCIVSSYPRELHITWTSIKVSLKEKDYSAKGMRNYHFL